jgi:N utilization substance protein B
MKEFYEGEDLQHQFDLYINHIREKEVIRLEPEAIKVIEADIKKEEKEEADLKAQLDSELEIKPEVAEEYDEADRFLQEAEAKLAKDKAQMLTEASTISENIELEKDLQYIHDKAELVLMKVDRIDELLNTGTQVAPKEITKEAIKESIPRQKGQYTGAKSWKTIRMNKVDLSILRLALYEMKWDNDIPVSVAINEAVELAKLYSSNEGPSFINGVLAKFVSKETKEVK